MASNFEELMEQLKGLSGDGDNEVLAALRALKDETGEDPTEEQILEVLKTGITDLLSRQETEDATLTDDDKQCMQEAKISVKTALDEMKLNYGERELREDYYLFELGFTSENVTIRVKVFVEANPHVCRIEAVLPILADETYAYPLCHFLAKENYAKRFGSFKYDERDGEIAYEHCFLSKNGIKTDEFDIYFHAVIRSALHAYDDIRRYCVGRFKSREVNEILKKVNSLVSEIND